ncbi:hypothetical protein TRIP_B350370 [uncultured Desulfatiglans sp.]|uniref:Uncharacterized protein n=1 Tax=Uncultured Desulfatiglans sp. TaxID=1748965 RepID=A0A653ABZ3_UNCDX|nr:hypothetical protein TRIP_B350370 [uncultured Desulfatiglans sp.]
MYPWSRKTACHGLRASYDACVVWMLALMKVHIGFSARRLSKADDACTAGHQGRICCIPAECSI